MPSMTVNAYGDVASSSGKTTTVDLADRFGHINLQGFSSPVLLEFEFVDRHPDQKLEILVLTLLARETNTMTL